MIDTSGPSVENVVAVIVTLRPEPDVIRHVETLIGGVLRVVVVDNGSGAGADSILDSIAALPSVEVIRNPANLGIARALNQGAEAAVEAGADWLLTLDQDAEPGPGIVGVAGHSFETYPLPDRIAVIGSTSTEQRARPTGAAQTVRPWSEAKAVITAGSFVSLPAFRAVGGFREDLFIDYVDIEFCLRARAQGYRVLLSRTPAMTHMVGQPTLRRIGPRRVTPTNHPAVRRYYITRNRLLVWRRYWRTDPGYVATDVLASQKELVKLLLFEEDRRKKVRATLMGLKDGLLGRSGPGAIEPAPASSASSVSRRHRR